MDKQATILALETATSSCSVAIEIDGVVIQRSAIGNNIHSQVLLDMVQQVLKEGDASVAQLDAVAVGQGPGSFTGLRIGVGVGQGIAYGAGCPMIGISSLAALAYQTQTEGYVLAGIDARMNEIYWALYKNTASKQTKNSYVAELIGDISVNSPFDISLQKVAQESVQLSESVSKNKLLLTGNAWLEYRNDLSDDLFDCAMHREDCVHPNATGVLALAKQAHLRGDTVQAVDFAPQYIRNNVATQK